MSTQLAGLELRHEITHKKALGAMNHLIGRRHALQAAATVGVLGTILFILGADGTSAVTLAFGTRMPDVVKTPVSRPVF